RSILHTPDGGATWTLQRKGGTVKVKYPLNRRQAVTDEPEPVDYIRFIDANHGWAWGGGRKDEYAEQPGVFLTTIDGGQNWNSIPFPFDQPVTAIFFLNGTHAWASTEGSFYSTMDGGVTWTKAQAKLPELAFNSLFFVDEKHGWAVGRSGRMAKTVDGGRTWAKIWQIKDEFVMRDIFFADRNHGWAVGESGAILFTPDGDETWVSIGAPMPAKLMDVVFVGNRAGWAVGLSGVVLRYEPK
ncbi:MAG TPA: YCF48-related protein, partial [Blastocatellia bacterium]